MKIGGNRPEFVKDGLRLSPPDYYEKIANETQSPVETGALADILGDNSLKSDLTHPNALGYRNLAQAVANLLKKAGAVQLAS